MDPPIPARVHIAEKIFEEVRESHATGKPFDDISVKGHTNVLQKAIVIEYYCRDNDYPIGKAEFLEEVDGRLHF